jgi:predicted Zn-dependent protease
MQNCSIKILTGLFIVAFHFSGIAQEDPVVLKAMKDELKRSMDELKLEDYERPFFISYKIADTREVNINASLGGLLRSADYPARNKTVRVMVGSYEFNDESLDLNHSAKRSDNNEIDMPLGDDYYGIRRSLWSTTDAIYRAAAMSFKDNVNFVQEQKKDISEMPHRSFAKAPVTQVLEKGPAHHIDQRELEELAKELSVIFRDYHDIIKSNVTIHCAHTDFYFINSEGTVNITADNIANITVNAQTKTDEGEVIVDQIVHTRLTTDKLPSLDSLRDEVRKMAERLSTLRKIPVFKDTYTGPVLFLGTAAVDVISTSLFTTGEALISTKNITNTYSTSNAKLGRKILDDRFTITSMPKLRSFNGQELLGSYQVDNEGVVPPDELVLIESGVLKNLLSDRTVTKEGVTSTGHGLGPGVIIVNAANSLSVEELKYQLMESAKDEGLEYAIIIRHFSSGAIRTVNTYKVSLQDGSEELVRAATVRAINMKSLKHVMGVSNGRIVRNTEPTRYSASISIIAPNALLLEEVEIEGARNNPYLDKEIYVENPIKQKREEQ